MKRPPIPGLEARCRAAMRQLEYDCSRVEHMLQVRAKAEGGMGKLLSDLLQSLAYRLFCPVTELVLDHNPALALRIYNVRTEKFTPDANDYYFLIYRSEHGHHRKTNVRGDGAQRSDTGERMHRRRMDENRGLRWRKPKPKIAQRKNHKWPKRKFG